MPLTGAIAKVVIHDLDQFFQHLIFQILMSWEWLELAQKCAILLLYFIFAIK